MAHLILRECGYRILEAASGVAALKVWERHRDEIDLVVTDMVMPEGMTGKDLAERLLASDPALKVLYTSGYSTEDIGKDGIRLLPKPYNRATLATAVRECLDA
jgi:two-component system, cell cycle sensor histidine kinase and response regulator CckA